jgi:hypothetical protein
MAWTALPVGGFTGIDWSRAGATTGFDPYLVWAEADDFAGYGLKGKPKWLPLLLEVAPGVTLYELRAATSPRWFYLPPIYTSDGAPAGLRFCTCRVKSEFFRRIRPGGKLHAMVRRFELGLPAGAQSADPHKQSALSAASARKRVDGKVVGLIDGGLAFAHANFLAGERTRIRHFWRQDSEGTGPVPHGFCYGHEFTGAMIEQAMRANRFGGLVDETRVYAQFDMGVELDKRLNHGTHVLDIACGPRTVKAQVAGVPPDLNAPPSWAPADDVASRCDIVAVQLDWDTVKDTSGGSMNVHIMDGLMYILSRCTASARIAVNLSWGTQAGPHDGTSMLEAAMDQLTALEGGRLQIVLPAGNGYQARLHANETLSPGEEVTLHWRGLPDDITQNFMELWLNPGATGVTIQVTPPGRDPLPPLAWGQSGTWNDDRGRPLCALIFPEAVATGSNGTCALLAVAPTASFDETRATSPSGVWELRIVNDGPGVAVFDAYVERDDEIIGVRTGARQSHFEDKLYDTSGNPDAFVDHPGNPTPIRRSGTFNSIATGRRTLTVAGTRIAGPSWALYSPRKPDPDAQRPQRPDVVKVPDTEAVSDENGILLGLKAASSRSGGVARMVGTSDAAPQVTRKVINAM